MLNSDYQPGKLYRIKKYHSNYFVLWTAAKTTSPRWGEHKFREEISHYSVDEDVIFLYLKFIEESNELAASYHLHLVICSDRVGAIDAGIELEEFVPLEEEPV